MKIKVELKAILIAFLIISASLGGVYLWKIFSPKECKVIYYDGIRIVFRQDLKKASEVPVEYKTNKTIEEILFNKRVKTVTIYFKPASSNGIYAAEAFEITFKLLNFTYPKHSMKPKFTGKEIEDYNLVNSSEENPAIVLVHPDFSNSTKVVIKDTSIYIYGKDAEGVDLATVRFLTLAMGIDINEVCS